jgi:hypothetical protein
MFLSSGLTAKSTTNNDPVELIAVPAGYYTRLIVANTGTSPGYIAIGLTAPAADNAWLYLEGGGIIGLDGLQIIGPTKVWLKRVPDGTDVTGVYAALY